VVSQQNVGPPCHALGALTPASQRKRVCTSWTIGTARLVRTAGSQGCDHVDVGVRSVARIHVWRRVFSRGRRPWSIRLL
jgi:hypothetical protein